MESESRSSTQNNLENSKLNESETSLALNAWNNLQMGVENDYGEIFDSDEEEEEISNIKEIPKPIVYKY